LVRFCPLLTIISVTELFTKIDKQAGDGNLSLPNIFSQ